MGWYHSGPKLAANDIEINEIIRRFVPHPVGSTWEVGVGALESGHGRTYPLNNWWLTIARDSLWADSCSG